MMRTLECDPLAVQRPLGRRGLSKERSVCGRCPWLCVHELELWGGGVAAMQPWSG